MTLCGVLKDILLVAASMIIWGTPISGLQFFGYGIALAGMVYYRLGYDALKGYAADAGRQWAEFGVVRPVTRKVIMIGAALLFAILLLGGLAPSQYTAPYVASAADTARKYGLGSS
jgi:hypothetical protein